MHDAHMADGHYRITSPTLALIEEGGRHVAHTVPTGAIVTVEGDAFDGEKLVNVIWDGKEVMMFAQDLRVRAEQVRQTSK